MNSPQTGRTARGRDLSEEISLPVLWDVLRRWWPYVILPTLLLTGAAVVYAKSLPSTYASRTLIEADFHVQTWNMRDNTVTAQLPLIWEDLLSQSLLEEVIREFDIYPAPNGDVSQMTLDVMKSRIGITTAGPTTFYLEFYGTDKEQLEPIATRLAELFVERIEEKTEARAAARVELIESEVAAVEKELLDKQSDLTSYRQNTGGRLPENLGNYLASMDRITNQISGTSRSISDEQVRRAQITAEIRQLDQLAASTVTSGGQVVSALDSRRMLLLSQLEEARRRYTEQHPEVNRLKAEIDNLDSAPQSDGTASSDGGPISTNSNMMAARTASGLQLRYIQLTSQLEGIDHRIALLEEEKANLIQELAEQEEGAGSLPEREQELAQLVRESGIVRTRYLDLVSRLEQARIAARLRTAGSAVSYQIAEAARVPSIPFGPDRRRIVLLGFLISLFVAGGLVFVRHQFDPTFADTAAVKQSTSLNVLGAIPRIPARLGFGGGKARRRRSRVVGLIDPRSLPFQQYRILASRLRQALDRECSQVLLVTSAGGGDGKTTTALNLSIALSELQEERVLLIDGDLRRPSVQKYLRAALEGEFDPAPEAFIDLLDHPDGRVSEHVSKVGKLYVMAGDGETADSLDALITSSPRSAMARLRKHFKYIVIDSPPILFMVDSHLLADIADRVALVVRARHTPREAFLRALESFDSSNLLGVIVNDVAHDQDGYRSASYYYQKRYLSAAKRSRTSIRARESA